MPIEQASADSHGEPGGTESSEHHDRHRDFERFRLLVENSQDIIAEVSPLGEVLYVSPNVRTLLGFAPDELLGGSLFAWVHHEDLRRVQEQFAIRAGRATGRHQHKDGSWRWLETSGREFQEGNGAIHRVLIARDVTAQKHAEEERDRLSVELARMEKLTALGTLASSIAHDFNNLLTAIVAYTEIARLDSQQPEVIDSLTQVLKATDRAKHLTRQVLAFSRPQKVERQSVSLAPIVREVLELMRPSIPPHISVTTELLSSAGSVLGDPTQIHQMIVNLCHNAVHAMRDRPGQLVVQLAGLAIDSTSPDFHDGVRPGSYTCLSISDTGHGMDSDTQRRIFEPFFTTKVPGEGTGIGLAVVQRVVRDHDGRIRVSSRPGEGSTFRIFFPVATNSQPSLAEGRPVDGRGERLLLVDDEPAFCGTAAAVLGAANYLVSAHTDPIRALEDFRAQPYNAVIVDLAMPGMNGVDFAVAVLKHAPRMPVLLTSGDFGTWTAEQACARGIYGVLAKPLTPASLLSAVKNALGNRCPQSRHPAAQIFPKIQ